VDGLVLFNIAAAGPAAAVPKAHVQNKHKEPARFFSLLKQYINFSYTYSINYAALNSPMSAVGRTCAIEALNISQRNVSSAVSELSSYKSNTIAKAIRLRQAKIRTLISAAGGLLMAVGAYLAFNYGQLAALSSTMFT
jgi:hypothetical protein